MANHPNRNKHLTTERVHFRLVQCPDCTTLLCCINPRYYNYCPECGKHILLRIRECVLVSDPDAILKYDETKLP